MRRPPRSTPFPTRRSSDLNQPPVRGNRSAWFRRLCTPRLNRSRERRSEEHTSELQSHHDLVCRLLLEKKKKDVTKINNAKNVLTAALDRTKRHRQIHQPHR